MSAIFQFTVYEQSRSRSLRGVDSSTAAAILHHQGYEVIGLTLLMKGKGQCCSEGMVDAAYEQLGIPHHIVDSREVFQANIVDYLVAGYSAGITLCLAPSATRR